MVTRPSAKPKRIGKSLHDTGDPLFSLNSTQDLAAELRRQKSGSVVLEALPQFLRATVKTPVYFAGLAGLAIALWRFPLRLVIPGMLFLRASCAFVATGLAGLSVIVRYLMVPSVMLCLFAAVTLGGFTMVGAGTRLRRAWAVARGRVTVLGLGYTAFNPPEPRSGSTASSSFAATPAAACARCWTQPAVADGLAAAPCRCRPTS